MTHDLKILPPYFEAAQNGTKPFELRKDDRNYQVGDTLNLREFDGNNYTGRTTTQIVTYKLCGGQYGLSDEYCILGLKEAQNER